jgi:hypothetical protein
MTSLRRALLAFLLSFLLLNLQQEVIAHAFGHLVDTHEQEAAAPHQGQPCATCELLASGADGVPASAPAPDADGASLPAARIAFASRSVAAPAPYCARAPPALS